MRLTNLTRILPACGVLLLACGGNAYDAAQVPKITIVPVIALPLVKISWEPAGAQQVIIYKGTQANGQSDLVVWSVTATAKNSIVSGIEYGTTNPPGGTVDVAAKPLTAGQPYTVQVSRVDPKASDIGGITSLGPRYNNSQTFTLATVIVAP